MIKNIILDFGRVLVDYDFVPFLDMLHDQIGDDEAYREFAPIISSEEIYTTLDREVKPFSENIKDFQAAYPRCAEYFAAFDRRFQEVVIGEVPGMRDYLKQLKAAGYRLYGLSNWSSKVYTTMQNYDEIFSLLDDRVLSCEEHLLKPEAEIYLRALEKLGIKPEESVFVDDKADNITGCKAVGIDGIVFTSTTQLKQELAARGIKA